MHQNRWKKSDSIFLSPSILPLTSFFSIRKMEEGSSFRWSNVLLFFHHHWCWRVVQLCSNGCVCISKCLFSLSFSTSILKVLTVLGDFPSIGKLQITSHFSLRRGKTENLLPLIAPGKALPKALLWLMAIRRLAVQTQNKFPGIEKELKSTSKQVWVLVNNQEIMFS